MYHNPFQYSCLENRMDGGAWWATDHRVAKSLMGLSAFTFTFTFTSYLSIPLLMDIWVAFMSWLL